MAINIELRCPHCDCGNLVRDDPQNYLRNACKRQFIRDEERTCQDTLGCITGFIKTMLVRGCGARDVAAMLGISARKVLKTLTAAKYALKPKRERCDCRLRHRIRRALRWGRNFSKKLLNRLKAFSPAFHCLNHGWICGIIQFATPPDFFALLRAF